MALRRSNTFKVHNKQNPPHNDGQNFCSYAKELFNKLLQAFNEKITLTEYATDSRLMDIWSVHSHTQTHRQLTKISPSHIDQPLHHPQDCN